MALTLDEVIVQKEPARPVYCEHSFVTWSSPVRGEADSAAVSEADSVALGLVGRPLPPAQPATANAPAQKHAITTDFIHTPSALPPAAAMAGPPSPEAGSDRTRSTASIDTPGTSPTGDRASGRPNGS